MSGKRANRLNAIVAFLQGVGGVGVTRKQVAAHLGIKVSPHLCAMLDEVAASGWAVKVLDENEYPPTWKFFAASPVQAVEKLTYEDWLH